MFKENTNSFAVTEEAELKTKVGKYDTKFNFKGNEIKGVVDLSKF